MQEKIAGILFLLFFCAPFSAQIYVQEGSAITVKGAAIIRTDTLIYEKEPVASAQKPVRIEAKLYASQAAASLAAEKAALAKKTPKKEVTPAIDVEKKSAKTKSYPVTAPSARIYDNPPSTEFLSFHDSRCAAVAAGGFYADSLHAAHFAQPETKNCTVFPETRTAATPKSENRSNSLFCSAFRVRPPPTA